MSPLARISGDIHRWRFDWRREAGAGGVKAEIGVVCGADVNVPKRRLTFGGYCGAGRSGGYTFSVDEKAGRITYSTGTASVSTLKNTNVNLVYPAVRLSGPGVTVTLTRL